MMEGGMRREEKENKWRGMNTNDTWMSLVT